jgi:WD40 repeat protein
VRTVIIGIDGTRFDPATPEASRHTIDLRPVNEILHAHTDRRPMSISQPTSTLVTDAPSRGEAASRRSGVSVTSLSFLNLGREHLLVSGSEANACLNLWDLRMTYTRRKGGVIPVSTTSQPESHNTHRVFGITSLATSGDASRIYSLCRDNTVYAYSTNHLIIGKAPELSMTESKPRWPGNSGREGLGPIYGFRHPKLHPTTFYVKMALRPAKDDRTELLAVGSGDACPILFPTDERYLRQQYQPASARNDIQTTPRLESSPKQHRPSLSRSSSGICPPRLNDTIPIYGHGTALTQGHRKEVSDVTWTYDGDLVTIGDDFIARCWREGPKARSLRQGGEHEGRRWGCGWAEADDEEDEYD